MVAFPLGVAEGARLSGSLKRPIARRAQRRAEYPHLPRSVSVAAPHHRRDRDVAPEAERGIDRGSASRRRVVRVVDVSGFVGVRPFFDQDAVHLELRHFTRDRIPLLVPVDLFLRADAVTHRTGRGMQGRRSL